MFRNVVGLGFEWIGLGRVGAGRRKFNSVGSGWVGLDYFLIGPGRGRVGTSVVRSYIVSLFLNQSLSGRPFIYISGQCIYNSLIVLISTPKF